MTECQKMNDRKISNVGHFMCKLFLVNAYLYISSHRTGVTIVEYNASLKSHLMQHWNPLFTDSKSWFGVDFLFLIIHIQKLIDITKVWWRWGEKNQAVEEGTVDQRLYKCSFPSESEGLFSSTLTPFSPAKKGGYYMERWYWYTDLK